ncbi:ABC transporter permease [Marinifilum caeruleilacunae]|uniref:FtsX-like permease family protein n=1 Tax=Marinifilum caeruleilacunae TaxID=2499076 RepID=A0ABX1WRJ1_9BACT|nr:ABC transporter permease [Marinifilum caeruleilacunae]NOU58549.1 FtsX-like permease family protein [Marinifilum caeruleilacunae]
MNKTKYILKSLWHFRKQHLAVLLGTIVSTAVLTGALIVGDSVRNSLHELVGLRLGKIEYAMDTGDRFVRSQLAREIGKDANAIAEPILRVEGIAIRPESNTRVNQIQVYGVDSTFCDIADSDIYRLKQNEVCISENLANRMDLLEGDSFLLRLRKASIIPANAPFVSDEDQSIALRLQVKSIAQDKQLGRFSLKSNQVAPYNLFVSRDFLSEELEIKDVANLILLAAEHSLSGDLLNNHLSKNWKLEDASLQLKKVDGKSQYELTSDRVFIDSQISNVLSADSGNKEQILSYFVNGFVLNDKETPYSFVTSTSKQEGNSLQENEIMINSWLADDLNAKAGDEIELKYYRIGALRQLVEESKSFIVKEVLPMDHEYWDASMMPSFPGLTDAGSCSEWEAGVPVDFSKIRPKDEEYWKQYKGTPKAYIAQNTALQLWSNKYGDYTALRFNNLNANETELREIIQNKVRPELLALQFESVRSEGDRAAGNMVDFGGLFLSLSFFIIAAAIILTVLIYSLNLDNRSKETGILLGLGFSQKQILSIRFRESLVTVLFGGLLGVLVGALYNEILIGALNSVWQDVVRTNMLGVHVKFSTLLIGYFSGLIIALLCIYFVSRKKVKQSVIGLIKESQEEKMIKKGKSYSLIFGIISLLLCGFIIVYAFVSSLEQNAEMLLSAGGLLLLALSFLVHHYLNKVANQFHKRTPGLGEMAIKNAARNRKRSLAIVVLLGLGTFSVLITGANRKTFYDSENSYQSGTGGYEYWIESTLPILNDLNSVEGQEKAGFWEGDLDKEVSFVQFRALEGDDASCLNLNQVSQPRILGFTTQSFEERHAFSFAKLLPGVDQDNPWKALNQDFGEGVIPAIADQTVILWGLKKAVGDTLIYQDENGQDVKLLLVGGLANSVFQGNILIADDLFQKHFPSVSGSKIVLADCLPQDSLFIRNFEDNLQDLGVQGTKTSDKMAAFYSVENTYLSMFMVLGGLGVIIGTIGLGIVLLRNVWERRKELAVLRAIGYTQKSIFKLLFVENLFLLVLGLLTGILSAFVGVLPSLFSNAFQMPYLYVLALLSLITISGLLWIYFPLRMLKRQKIIDDLKNE